MEPIPFIYICKECEAELECKIIDPGRPAKISGPPENCYPAEDIEIDYPDECPECNTTVDEDKLFAAAYEKFEDETCDSGPDPDDQRDRDIENRYEDDPRFDR